MKFTLLKTLCVIVAMVVGSIAHAFDYQTTLPIPRLFDPTLSVVNQSNTAYNMTWESGTAETVNKSLSFNVKNHGTVSIAPNSKSTVKAHFFSLSDNDNIPKKTHAFSIKLYDKNNVKIAESHIIHNIVQNKCGVLLSDINVIINKENIPIIVIDNETNK